MPRILILTVLLLLCLGPAVANGGESLRQVMADQRIVLDLTFLDFDPLLGAARSSLHTAVITPSKTSGTLIWKYKYGTTFDSVAGKNVSIVQQGTPLGYAVDGQYQIVDTSAQTTLQPSGHYHWIAPFSYYPNDPHGYMPYTSHDNRFLLGGTILCTHNDFLSGSNEFSDDSLIPASWQRYVAGALEYHKEHPDFFSPDNARKNNLDLVKLANSSNPFLSIEATRRLAGSGFQSGFLGTPFIQSSLARADFYKQAVLTLLLLQNKAPDITAITEAESSALINSSTKLESIKGIALAAYIAEDNVLLSQLDKKVDTLSLDDPAETYIVTLLKAAGVRK